MWHSKSRAIIWKFLIVSAFVGSAQARTVWLSHPEGDWANVILQSSRSHSRDEHLCASGDALKFYDALKIRAEAGTDAAVKQILLPGLRLKCENVSGFGFVSCGLQFLASPHVTIDSKNESLRATWIGQDAQDLAKIWDRECTGANFVTDDSKFKIEWSHEKVEMTFGNP